MKEISSPGLEEILAGPEILCHECRQRLKTLSLHVNWQGKKLRVLYEQEEEFESLWDAYVRHRDVSLAPVFLFDREDEIEYLKKHELLSSQIFSHAYEHTGFDPLDKIFQAGGLHLSYVLMENFGRYSYKDKPADDDPSGKKRRIAIALHLPSEQDLKYNPVLKDCEILWVLAEKRSNLQEAGIHISQIKTKNLKIRREIPFISNKKQSDKSFRA